MIFVERINDKTGLGGWYHWYHIKGREIEKEYNEFRVLGVHKYSFL